MVPSAMMSGQKRDPNVESWNLMTASERIDHHADSANTMGSEWTQIGNKSATFRIAGAFQTSIRAGSASLGTIIGVDAMVPLHSPQRVDGRNVGGDPVGKGPTFRT